ncbi:hypothetical protein BS78_K014700 [Paspalum vaginatum]|uniref:Uncharacterized protein n=1 Tax=Paspalum vaginatum TaxID=158149 RepID=A0A9W8CG79_9POAL|nr:hypothetical protein BS78_K014700 [Paspalum vaginatum]
MRHNQRVYAEFVESPVKPRYRKFDSIQLCDIVISWTIVVMVDIKFPIQSHSDSQRFILKDDTGSIIDAVVRGGDTGRFNRLLTQGCSYTIHEMGFQKKYRLDHISVVKPSSEPVVFGQYPKHLMPFDGVFQCPENIYTDISGIVVHWRNQLVVGIWSKLLVRHAIKLPKAACDKDIILGSMLRIKDKHRCLETSDHMVFEFNPTHSSTSELKALQQALYAGAVDLSFMKIFLEK